MGEAAKFFFDDEKIVKRMTVKQISLTFAGKKETE
jgi:hypothetical protein